MECSNRKLYLEIVRIIAIVLVVINHTDLNYYYYHDPSSGIITFLISLIFTILCTIDVPLFFMISGALLLGKTETIKEVYQKRVIRIVFVIIIFSILQYVVKISKGEFDSPSLKDFILRLLSGNIQETYWFLYAYLGYMMLLPFFRKMAISLSDKEFIYLICIKMIFDLINPVLIGTNAVQLSNAWGSAFASVTANVWYFFAGYWVETKLKDKDVFKQYNLNMLKAASFIGIILPVAIITSEYACNVGLNDLYITMTTPLLSISVFIFAKYVFSRKEIEEGGQQIICRMGKCVFAVYLTEWFARAVFLPMYKTLIMHIFGVLACLIYIVCSLILAFMIAGLLKKIPGLNKLI